MSTKPSFTSVKTKRLIKCYEALATVNDGIFEIATDYILDEIADRAHKGNIVALQWYLYDFCGFGYPMLGAEKSDVNICWCLPDEEGQEEEI